MVNPHDKRHTLVCEGRYRKATYGNEYYGGESISPTHAEPSSGQVEIKDQLDAHRLILGATALASNSSKFATKLAPKGDVHLHQPRRLLRRFCGGICLSCSGWKILD